jgi:hypothetical protein
MKLLKELPPTIEVDGVTYHTAFIDPQEITGLPVMGEDGKVEWKDSLLSLHLKKEGYIT